MHDNTSKEKILVNETQKDIFNKIICANCQHQGDYAFQAYILSALKPFGW